MLKGDCAEAHILARDILALWLHAPGMRLCCCMGPTKQTLGTSYTVQHPPLEVSQSSISQTCWLLAVLLKGMLATQQVKK